MNELRLIQAPMAGGATTPELVAAVSNAGALGSLGAGYMSADALCAAIEKTRQLSSQAFNTNVFIPSVCDVSVARMQQACDALALCCESADIDIEIVSPPYQVDFHQQMEVLLELRVPVMSFTFGLLEKHWLKKLKQHGTQVIGMATQLEEAQALDHLSVDAIVLQGERAGGHRGTFIGREEASLNPLEALLSQVRSSVSVPLIAAGGISQRQQVQDLLAQGASGVQVGTAFLTCDEAGVPDCYKQTLLSQTEDTTVLTRCFSGRLARGVANHMTTYMADKADVILPYPAQNRLTRALRQWAKGQGNTEYMSLWAGQSVADCQARSAAAVVSDLLLP